jgi:hypothetical protein
MIAKSAETNAPYWHNSKLTPCMGCLSCPDRDLCGGLNIGRDAMSCVDLCTCKDPRKCDRPCIRNPRVYVGRMLEVNGFDLETIPRTQVVDVQRLPSTIPILFQKNRRSDRLTSPAVAIRFKDLFSEKTGRPKFESREQLAAKFLFDPDAQLVVIGVSEDKPIETYWGTARNNGFPGVLSRLRPTLITTPNFSMFNNTVRWPDLHNMKRIAISWWEMAEAGLPASLHVHGRTDRDYERWTEFIVKRDEVRSVTFEFGTGAGIPVRSEWHIQQLIKLGRATGGRLQLLIKGGWRFARRLNAHFAQVVFLDSDSFMKAVARKMMDERLGKVVWDSAITLEKQGIDTILQHNADKSASMR